MNNEEKILGLLSQIDVRLGGIETDMGSMKADIDTMKTEMGTMKADIDTMKTEMVTMKEGLDTVRRSTLKAELVEYPRIQAALDGIVGVIENNKLNENRLRVLENKVERIDADVYKLKSV